jgi:hypothetical protein
VELLYSEPAADETSAIRRELHIKRWTAAKKLALIAGDRRNLKTLARCRAQHGPPGCTSGRGPVARLFHQFKGYLYGATAFLVVASRLTTASIPQTTKAVT